MPFAGSLASVFAEQPGHAHVPGTAPQSQPVVAENCRTSPAAPPLAQPVCVESCRMSPQRIRSSCQWLQPAQHALEHVPHFHAPAPLHALHLCGFPAAAKHLGLRRAPGVGTLPPSASDLCAHGGQACVAPPLPSGSRPPPCGETRGRLSVSLRGAEWPLASLSSLECVHRAHSPGPAHDRPVLLPRTLLNLPERHALDASSLRWCFPAAAYLPLALLLDLWTVLPGFSSLLGLRQMPHSLL
mmetsp:Transcript_64445/g.124082  ORF Transcript_64445/g.124082 Transcript_64445/m.124082 type:complete len:242 (-) Transcript_64445:1221-1946(-)